MSIKQKLHELCGMKDWTIPVYSHVKEGQDHIPVFYGLVEVNGKKFQSSSHFENSKAAKNDAAKIAFSILTHEETQDEMNQRNRKKMKVTSTSSNTDKGETSDISSLPTMSEETCISPGLAVPILKEPREVSLTVYTSIPYEELPSGNLELLPVDEGKWKIVRF